MVMVRTVSWGHYLGKLIEILPDTSPWRGIVEISAVLKYPDLVDRERWPFSEGSQKQFAALDISPYEGEPPPPYLESVVEALRQEKEFLDGCSARYDLGTDNARVNLSWLPHTLLIFERHAAEWSKRQGERRAAVETRA